jgi:hypothetical protein
VGLNDLPKWLYVLGRLRRTEGYPDQAWLCVREGLALHQQMGCPAPAVRGVEVASGLLMATQGRSAAPLSVRLFGAAAAKRRASGLPLPRAEESEYRRDVAFASEQMAPEGFARAWNEGEASAR